MHTHLNVCMHTSGVAHTWPTYTGMKTLSCIQVHESFTHSIACTCVQADSNVYTNMHAGTGTDAQVHRADYTNACRGTIGHTWDSSPNHRQLWTPMEKSTRFPVTPTHNTSTHRITRLQSMRAHMPTTMQICTHSLTHAHTHMRACTHTHMPTRCLALIITHAGKIHTENY